MIDTQAKHNQLQITRAYKLQNTTALNEFTVHQNEQDLYSSSDYTNTESKRTELFLGRWHITVTFFRRRLCTTREARWNINRSALRALAGVKRWAFGERCVGRTGSPCEIYRADTRDGIIVGSLLILQACCCCCCYDIHNFCEELWLFTGRTIHLSQHRVMLRALTELHYKRTGHWCQSKAFLAIVSNNQSHGLWFQRVNVFLGGGDSGKPL